MKYGCPGQIAGIGITIDGNIDFEISGNLIFQKSLYMYGEGNRTKKQGKERS